MPSQVIASHLAPVARRRGIPAAWAAGLLCALAVLPSRLYDIIRFDEGFIVTGAMMVRDGLWPLRDFYTGYGPAQFVVDALLHAVFGADLLVTRLADAAVLGLAGAAVLGCVRRLAGARAAWLSVLAYAALTALIHPSANYPAFWTLPLLLGAALLFGDWACGGRTRRLVGASLLVGLTGLLRWDFGLFGTAALGAAVLAVQWRRRHGRARAFAAGLLPALGVVCLVYLPLIAGHAHRWFDEVPLFLALEFRKWRNVDLLRPALASLVQGGPAGAAGALYALGLVAFPFIVLGAATWQAARGTLRAPERPDRATGTALLLAFVGVLLLNQLRVRTNLWQAFPAIVVALTLTAWTARSLARGRPALRVAAAGLVALLCAAAAVQQYRWWSRADAAVSLPGATGIRLPTDQGWREYAALLGHLRAGTSPDEPIFSGVGDTSRLYINDPMLYFLAERRPATRFVEMEPGIANTERAQREIADELERHRVRTIVLAHYLSREPNRTAVSNGVTLLDEYVRRRYTPTARFGVYTVLVRRDDAAFGR